MTTELSKNIWSSWNPEQDDQKYLSLIAAMTTDCLLGRGPDNRETYLNNLETCIRLMREVRP